MVSIKTAKYRLQRQREALLQKALTQKNKTELLIECYSPRAVKELARLGTITHEYGNIPYLGIELEPKDAAALVKGKYPGVLRLLKKIEAQSTFKIPGTARSKSLNQWNLENIGAYKAHEYGDGQGVSVGIIDTGVEYTHAEISGNFGKDKGYDFVKSDPDPMDKNGHGTHVAGIISGTTYGVAPGATLYALRVLDENGSGKESNVIAAVDYAINKHMDVANLSLGSNMASSAFEEICYAAYEKGLILVAAAGNDGGEYPSYPAAFGEPVVAVAAVDRYNEHAYFSNTYITNDVSAPGVSITSSYLNGSHATLDGTSMATPHVTGSIAISIPFFRHGSVDDLIDSTAQKIGDGDRETYGAGLIRADKMAEKLSSGGLLEKILQMAW